MDITNHSEIALLLSFLITLLTVPLVRRIAFAANIVDYPSRSDVKKIHTTAKPLLGGLAIFVGVTISLLFAGELSPTLKVCLLLSLIILILGLLDDRKPLTYRPRLMVQMIVASIMVFFLPMTPFAFGSFFLAVAISLFWIIGVTNAVNLMDNIDGAATGVAAIAAASLAVVAHLQGNHLALVFSLALFGACLAFLIYNFRPASIFLGDAGCLFLGFSLAVISLTEVVVLQTTIFQYLAFPFLLGVPIFDTTFATVRRIAKGRAIYLADGSNLTYRFLEKGWSRGRVVLMQYALQILFSLVAFGLLYLDSSLALLLLVVGLGVPITLSRYLA